MNLNKYHFFWKVSLSCIFGNHTFWLGGFSGGSRPSDKGEGEGGRLSRPWDKWRGGRFPKNWEKNFGRKIRWGGGGRSPGSATALPEREQAVWSHCYENDYFNSRANKMKLIFTRKVLHEALFWKWVFGFRKWSIEPLLHDSACWHQSIYLLYF